MVISWSDQKVGLNCSVHCMSPVSWWCCHGDIMVRPEGWVKLQCPLYEPWQLVVLSWWYYGQTRRLGQTAVSTVWALSAGGVVMVISWSDLKVGLNCSVHCMSPGSWWRCHGDIMVRPEGWFKLQCPLYGPCQLVVLSWWYHDPYPLAMLSVIPLFQSV